MTTIFDSAHGLHLISAPQVFDGAEFHHDLAVVMQDERVQNLVSLADVPTGCTHEKLPEGVLSPGLVDLQANGGGGVLLINQPDLAGVETMVRAHREQGTTSLLPTVMSEAPGCMLAAVQAVAEASLMPGSGVLGVHVEGPFFNPEKRGAHATEFIRTPQPADNEWLALLKTLPSVLTLAPETVPVEFIGSLSTAGVRVFAGHTAATAEQVRRARDSGLAGFTHLYNAMGAASAREPGVTGSALTQDSLYASIIADGVHVHPDMLHLARRQLGSERLMLISDAMATVGADTPEFALYGDALHVEGERVVNQAGRLAGSAIALADAVRYAVHHLGWPLADALRMATGTPADCMGVADSVGYLRPGNQSNLVWWQDDLSIRQVWMGGQPVESG